MQKFCFFLPSMCHSFHAIDGRTDKRELRNLIVLLIKHTNRDWKGVSVRGLQNKGIKSSHPPIADTSLDAIFSSFTMSESDSEERVKEGMCRLTKVMTYAARTP